MSEFKKGQRVRVEYEGTVLSVGAYSLMLKMDSGQERVVRIGLPELKVTILDPPDWPPQVGDIWEAEGIEWFAGHYRVLDQDMDMVLTHAETRHWIGTDSFKLRNPVLVRRRGQ